jgi:hypothetical protein
MPLYNKPISLEKLSLDVVGNFVSDVSTRLANLPVSSTNEKRCTLFSLFKTVFCYTRILQGKDTSGILHHAEEACKRLRYWLYTAVDQKFANEITMEVLSKLDKCAICRLTDSSLGKKILQKLVYASLNTDLTELDITYKRIASLVVSRMWTMGKLRTLKVTCWVENEALLEDMKKYLPTFYYLEQFSFRIHCTDDVLNILCWSCRHLKCLDISGSHRVTDDGVNSIARLLCLNELKLICTDISERGYLGLMNSLARQPNYIKNFGCDCYSDTQLLTLVTDLINIREISLRICGFSADVCVLEHLENLTVLRLKYCLFSDVVDLILKRGYQLRELDLESSGNLDLKFISENCHNLVRLVIRERMYEYEKCSSFPKLQYLMLQTRDPTAAEILLSQCHNLTTLELCTVREFYDHHMCSVLRKNPFEHLQTLSMGTLSGSLSPGTVGLISEHCVKLSEFKVFGEPGVNMKFLCELYPGLQIVPELWSKLADKEAIVNAGLDLDSWLDGD